MSKVLYVWEAAMGTRLYLDYNGYKTHLPRMECYHKICPLISHCKLILITRLLSVVNSRTLYLQICKLLYINVFLRFKIVCYVMLSLL